VLRPGDYDGRYLLLMSAFGAAMVRDATREDYGAIRALLVSAGLPVEDLDTAPGLRFWVAEESGEIAGAIGLEARGRAGLLRSLAVAPSYRQQGLGSALVEALEREAPADGVAELVLLTQTAAEFFNRRGFEVVDRSTVPEEIRQCAEFRTLCPASALCMVKASISPKLASSNV
jgi:amino-acid N-acetyltransferase